MNGRHFAVCGIVEMGGKILLVRHTYGTAKGRILVPQSLREVAGLEKEIVVAGVSDRCEIWDKKRWDDFNSSIDDNELMEALEGLDF